MSDDKRTIVEFKDNYSVGRVLHVLLMYTPGEVGAARQVAMMRALSIAGKTYMDIEEKVTKMYPNGVKYLDCFEDLKVATDFSEFPRVDVTSYRNRYGEENYKDTIIDFMGATEIKE